MPVAVKQYETVQKLKNRYASLKNIREPHVKTWKQLTNATLPRLGVHLYSDQEWRQGKNLNQDILDETAGFAAQDMAYGYATRTASPARPWFRFKVGDKELDDDYAVKTWLARLADLSNAILASSNFYESWASLCEHLAVVGTAVMLVMPDYDDVVYFDVLWPGTYCIASDDKGNVNTLYFERNLSVQQIVDAYSLEVCSDTIKNQYDNGQYDAMHTVCVAIEPNKNSKGYFAVFAVDKPFASVHWLKSASDTDKPLRVSGFNTFPAIAMRWHTTGGESYGRSQAHMALSSIQRLQQIELVLNKLSDKAASPPVVMPSQMSFDKLSTEAAAIIFDNTGAIQAAPARALYEVNPTAIQMVEQRKATTIQQIERAFFKHLFSAFIDMDLKGTTAYGLGKKYAEQMLMLGPVVTRNYREGPDKILDRLVDIITEAELMPPPPPVLRNKKFKVQYISDLAQAQMASSNTAIEAVMGFVGNAAALYPEARHKINILETIDEYADSLGAPPRILRSDEDVMNIQHQEAQAAAKLQLQQEMGQAVGAAKLLSETNVGGGRNALEQITGL